MKPKTIRNVIKRKIEDWLKSIDDPVVKEAAAKDVLVTGGSIASMLLGQPANDFDLYFKTIETVELIAKYYLEKFLANPPTTFLDTDKKVELSVWRGVDRVKIIVKSAGIASESGEEISGETQQSIDGVMMPTQGGNFAYQYFEQNPDDAAATEYVENVVKAGESAKEKDKNPFRPVFLSSNAITLSDGVQLIIRFFGEASVIHENYDYVHCTCSYDYATGSLVLPNEALTAILSKELRYVGSKYPICSLIRMRKFLQREWKITAGQIVKMCWDVSKLDLNDINVLEEQLVGVDAAYFAELLSILKKDRDDGKIGVDIDRSYLMSVIDRIF